jgi:tetratricopeptide (TPR) repeat protein
LALIAVHDYLQQIDQLIDDSRLTEAVVHCRYILEHYPRFVDAYRLLGKALLEQQKFADATDVFQRVLSAEPEDFIAHAALSIIHKEARDLPQAIWHMERAFEMDPYSGPIREELKDLYARRDGLKPERLFLTSAALARLYYRGGLYQQAVAELRRLLANGDNRSDLQSLLAESLWQDDQRVDAVEVGLDLLSRLPNCISANAVLAEVWLITGRIDEAQDHLQRLQKLTLVDRRHCDPDTAVGRAFLTEGATSLPDCIELEQLEYVPGFTDDENASDWVRELSLSLEEDGEEAGESTGWLEALDATRVEPTASEVAAAEVTIPRDDSPESEESGAEFDWLREVATRNDESASFAEQSDPEMESLTAVEDESADWFATTAEPDRPDDTAWPDDTLSEESLKVAHAPDWPAAGSDLDDASATAEEFPDWLAGSDLDDVSATAEEFPDWLAGSDLDDVSATAEEFPDWLAGSDLDDVSATAEEFPDWLAGSSDDPVATASGEELPGWLAESSDDLDAAAIEKEDFSDWLAGNGDDLVVAPDADDEIAGWGSERDEFLATAAMDSNDSQLIEGRTDVSDEEIPDWLLNGHDSLEDETMGASDQSDKFEEPVPDDFDEAMAWLEKLAAKQGAPTDELPSVTSEQDAMAAPDEESESDLPAWLKLELEDAPAADVEGIPAWLQPLDVSEDEAEPDGADWLEMAGPADLTGAGSGEEPVVAGDELPDWLKEQMPDDLNESAADSASGADLTWLDQIAAGEGAAIEEPPTLSWEEVGDTAGGDDLAWIDQLAVSDPAAELDASEGELPEEFEPELEHATIPDIVEEEATIGDTDLWPGDEMPDDPDEAMAWLEQLAAQQGAPMEELLSLSADMAETDAADAIPDWLREEMPEDLTPAMEAQPADEWERDSQATFAAADLEDDSEIPADAALMATMLSPAMADGEDEEPVTAVAADELPEPVMADGEGEEPVTAVAADELPEPAMADGEDEEPVTAVVADELPEPVMADAAAEAGPIPAALSAEDELAGDIPDDPDEAMAWLERLAAQQGAPLEELLTIETEAELDWSTVEGPADETETVILAQAIDIEPVSEEVAIESAAEEGETEPDDTMAWLERLASGEDEVLEELSNVLGEGEEKAAVDEWAAPELEVEEPAPDAAAVTVPAVEPPAAEAEQIAAVPAVADDLTDDDGLAWLEQLAARQGASLDELTSVAEIGEDVTMPDWLTAEMAAAAEQSDTEESAVAEVVVDGEEEVDFIAALAALEDVPDESAPELASESAVEVEQALVEADQTEVEEEDSPAVDEPGLEDDDIVDSLPEWLSRTPTGQSSSEEVDWLDDLIATDIDSWLTAEEEITLHDPVAATGPLPPLDAHGMPQTQPRPRARPEPEPEAESEVEVAPVHEPEPEAETVSLAVSESAAGTEIMAAARQALIARDYQQALAEYAALLNSDVSLRLLVADLETAVTNHSRQPLLRRLLGDAYMRNGQLQKALDTYRRALEQM